MPIAGSGIRANLNEVNATYPGISIINQGIQAALDSPCLLDFYAVYMDTDPAVYSR